MYDLRDKVALVTGGSQGIGKAIARNLQEAGCKVLITARNEERLQRAADELGVDSLAADVSKEADVLRTFDHIKKKYGKLDILINNAGLGRGWNMVSELEWDDFEYVFGVNVFGAAMVAREASILFKKQNSGNIVNIASTAALKGYSRGTVYCASKFALRGMTECWRSELRPHNVRVMLINPSEVTTGFGQEGGQERPEQANKLRAQEIADATVSALKMDQRGFIPELTVWATNPF